MCKQYTFRGIVILTLAVSCGSLFASGTVWSEVEDNIATVHHDDAWFNCCPGFVTWSEHDSNDYFILNIYELDTLHACKCMCYYDLERVFSGLAPGTYTAKVWEAPYETFSLAGTTDFVIPIQAGSPGVSGSVSECHVEPGVLESYGEDEVGFGQVSIASTEIRYALLSASTVSVSIYDAAGRRIRTFDEGRREKGEYFITWDCRDEIGQPQPRGIYFVRLATMESVRSLPLILLR